MSKVRAYITSFRLRTLPLSLSGVLLGSLLAASDGYFKTTTFVWAMLTTVALQILSNLANEVVIARGNIFELLRDDCLFLNIHNFIK